MFFWWICGEERVLPVLFLHHLSLPSLNYYRALARCEWQDKRGWVGSSFSLLVYLLLLVFTTIFTFQGKWCGTRSEMQIHVCTWTFWRIEFVSDVWFYTFCNELTCNWVPNTSGMTKFYSVLPFSLKWDVHLNMYNIIYETSRQSRFNARYWTGISFHTWYFTSINAILPNLPTLSLSHRVHKTVLYISVSFAGSYTGLLLPSF